MAVSKDVQQRIEDKMARALGRGEKRLEALGVLMPVPREVQKEEARAMLANPALIAARVQELAQGMPLPRAQLIVAEQLDRFREK